MEIFMQVNILMVKEMDKEYILGKMEIFMQVNILIVKEMEKGF